MAFEDNSKLAPLVHEQKLPTLLNTADLTAKVLINESQLAEITKQIDNISNQPIVDLSSSPGSKRLIAGDKNAGFLGFVQPTDFITGATLATALGISQGTLINNDTPWIKYIWKGKICFTPLKPIRHSTTWDTIYNAGAVCATDDEGTLPPMGRAGTGISIDSTDNSINTTTQNFLGDKSVGMDYADTVGAVGDVLVLKGWSNAENNVEVTIASITNTKIVVSGEALKTEAGGKKSRFYKKTNAVTQNKKVKIGDLDYKVRLFRGANTDPTDSCADADRDGKGPNDEWNWIMGQLHEQAKLKNWAYPAYMDSELGDFGVYLTDKDMVAHYDYGYGSYTWCQEVQNVTSWRRVSRGVNGVSYLGSNNSWSVGNYYGWRPCLELHQTATL